jgi:thiamine-monophosphate kinase
LGEFGLIDLLNGMVTGGRTGAGTPHSVRLLVDTGDDTAVWDAGPGRELFTTDTMVEGVHFTRTSTPWPDLGWKSIASNVSDVAAMGGSPAYALITLGLPPETEVEDLKLLYRGMLEAGNAFGVAIIGGDVVRSPVLFITVGLTGVMEGQPMLRTNARPGDVVALTGFVGSSGGGLRLMQERPDDAGGDAEFLAACHRRPSPAVAEGKLLAGSCITTAMDVSDGLYDDLSKLCRASGVSARIDAAKLPAHPALRRLFPQDWLGLALGGGEDYVLLFSGTEEAVEPLVPKLGDGAAVIGEIGEGTPGDVTVAGPSGEIIDPASGGWDHFR